MLWNTRLAMRFILISICFGLGLTWSGTARSEDGAGEGGSEIGLFVGSFLPNQIDGVSEILPVFGASYGFPALSSMAEFGFTNSHAEGVDFTTVSASLRADLPPVDGFQGLIGGGLDFNFYRPTTAEDRTSETGIHLNLGMLAHATDTLWIRTDLKFMANPGTSLTLLFGLVFKTGP